MYSSRKGLILGFHGCDRQLRDDIISKQGVVLNRSNNAYDWLGGGVYFWQNDANRAMKFAKYLSENPPHNKKQKITNPAVLGAVIDLGYCLDLLDSAYLELLNIGYESLKISESRYGITIPTNLPLKENGDLLIRYLDCAVIESIHQFNIDENVEQFDSVRGVFFEGDDLYPNAGFKKDNHIQIAIRNPNCIKGFFAPRLLNNAFRKI